MLTIRLEVILWTRVIVRWGFTDPKAVNKLQVAQTTASYKMHQNGLAGGLEKQLFDKLKEGFFFISVSILMKQLALPFIKS